MTPEQRERVRELWLAGRSYGDISGAVGASWDAVRDFIRRNRHRWGERLSAQLAQEDPVAAERARARAQRAREAERLLVQVRAWQEELVEAIRRAALVAEAPKPLRLPPPRHANADSETEVALLSDVHIGAKEHDRDGHPQSLGITLYQWRRWEATVAKLLALDRAMHPVRRLHILVLGDLVDGYLRPSHAFRLAMDQPEQAVIAGGLLAEAVLTFLQLFPDGDGPQVILETVDGNHDRVTQRPGLAGLSELSPRGWSWVAAKFAEAVLAEAIRQGRVEVRVHGTILAQTEVEGWPVFFEHGSTVRAGSSYGGIPAGPLKNSATAILQDSAEAGIRPFLLYAVGHFHQMNTLHFHGRSQIALNGAFPAITEYERSIHKAVRVPVQRMFSVHERQGVTTERPIWLPVPREAVGLLAQANTREDAEEAVEEVQSHVATVPA